MKKLLFIYNEKSGKAQIKKYLADIIDIFVKAGYRVEAHPTQERGDATKKVIKYGMKFDRIVCSGGDGTLNETITGLLQSDWYYMNPIPLGYIPAGSTNDFATSIKLPKNMVSAAQVAVSGKIKTLDMGSFNDRNFVYVAAFGAFINVSYNTPQELKNIFGHQAYIVEGVRQFGPEISKTYHIKLIANGKKLEGDFIYGMVSNSNSVGGFRGISGRDVGLDDGLFEVTLVKKPETLFDFQEIVSSLLSGKRSSFVYRFKTSHVKFYSEEKIEWVIDGEFAGAQKMVDIENYHNAILAVTGENAI